MTDAARPSRFAGLAKTVRQIREERADLPAETSTETPPAEAGPAAPPEPLAVPPTIAQEATKDAPMGKGRPKPPRPETGANAAEAPGKVGRPPGKRSDETFRQVSALVRRDTYKATQRRLLEEEREFSELVQALLIAWLDGKVRA